jgi:hypothetical protein
VRIFQRISGIVFAMSFTTLIPFWAVKGTEPAGSAVMWILYGALGASAAIWAVATYFRWREAKHDGRLDAPLPLVNRLKLKLKEGQALMVRLDPAFPDIEVLKVARAWQTEVYRMLVAHRKDLAQKFLEGSDPIEERETQTLATVNPARFLLEEHTACLAEIIEALESRSPSAARRRGSPALGRS